MGGGSDGFFAPEGKSILHVEGNTRSVRVSPSPLVSAEVTKLIFMTKEVNVANRFVACCFSYGRKNKLLSHVCETLIISL